MKNYINLAIDYVIGISIFCVIWLYYVVITMTEVTISPPLFSKWLDWDLNPLMSIPLVIIAILMLLKTFTCNEDLKKNWPIFPNLGIFIGWIVAFHGQYPAIWLFSNKWPM